MNEVLSSATFKRVGHRLGTSTPSSQLLRVAKGVIVQSEAKWKGEIEVNGVRAEVVFEVFDSGGKWDFFFRKTLLETFKATHDYELDEITLRDKDKRMTLRNQAHVTSWATNHSMPETPICLITKETSKEDKDEPSEISMEAFQGDSNLFT